MCYTDRQFDNRARQILELTYARDDIQKQIDALAAEVKEHMDGAEAITTNHYKIENKAVPTKRFDVTAFKQLYDELYTEFLKLYTVRRFTVKEVQHEVHSKL